MALEYIVPPGKTMSIKDATALLTAPNMPLEMDEAVIFGEKLRVWKNAPPSMRALMMACHLYGQRDFIVFNSTRISFIDFYARAVNLGHSLARHGIGKGDRVAILMRNYPEWIVAFFAVTTIGAIVVPYCVRNSAPKIVFVDPPRLSALQQHWPALQKDGIAGTLVVVGGPVSTGKGAPKGLVAYDAFANSAGTHSEMLDVDIAPDDYATIMYTSGTTGRPKGALGTHRNFISQLFGQRSAVELGRIRSGEGLPNVADPATLPQQALLVAVPLFHATGCISILSAGLAGGIKLVMMEKWEPEAAMKLIVAEKITTMGGVPTLLWQLLEHPNVSKYDLSSLESLSSGGAPSAPELLQLMKKKVPKGIPRNGYGLTETSAGIVWNYGYDYYRKPDSVGIPIFTSEAMIVEPGTTKELPVGTIGEIALKGPGVIPGYYNNPEGTAKSFKKGGWFLSGDLGRMDEEGFVYVLDRAKDMIIRGGENVYCVEVENCLFQHPAILDCAVIGIPDRVLGEHVGAVVQLTPATPRGSVTARDIQEFCKPHLGYFKIPIYIEFREADLPRNAAGKVLKGVLREEVVKGFKEWQAKGGMAKL
ncbi:AMP-dependent synthetase and ligase [Zopfochytrium polystomum]|nr:AMP-dependent synthetase and ligase [Zopfochytrium polystomum]